MTKLDLYNAIFDMEDNSGLRELLRVMLGATLESRGHPHQKVREFYLLNPTGRKKGKNDGKHLTYRTRHARFMESSVPYNLLYSEIRHVLEAFANGRLIRKFAKSDYKKVSLDEIAQQSEAVGRTTSIQRLLKERQKRSLSNSGQADMDTQGSGGSSEADS